MTEKLKSPVSDKPSEFFGRLKAFLLTSKN